MVEQYIRGQFSKDNHHLYQSALAFTEGRQVPGIQVLSIKQYEGICLRMRRLNRGLSKFVLCTFNGKNIIVLLSLIVPIND